MPEGVHIGTPKKLYHGHFPGATSYIPPGLTPLKTTPHYYKVSVGGEINTNKFISGPSFDEVANPQISQSLKKPEREGSLEREEVLPEKVVFKVL